jgi:hypothetical protein
MADVADVDDPVISDDLIMQLGRSIDNLFDRFLDEYKSGRTFSFFKKALTRSDITFSKALSGKALAEELDQGMLTSLKNQTDTITSHVIDQMKRLKINELDIPNVIGYVCDFVNHIEIEINKKDKLLPTLLIHDCQGKCFSITENLYCPAQSLFITLMEKLCAKPIEIPRIQYDTPRSVTFTYKIPKQDKSSFAANQSTCETYYTTISEPQESPESQGGSKSRHTHRRKHRRYSKHPRKTRHKRGERRVRSYAKRRCASKSHKRRRSR